MALIRSSTYPGRFDAPTIAQPQGAFKNRSAPGAGDGSYNEKEWANDWSALFSSLLEEANITPSGLTDEVGDSQYFDALKSVIVQNAPGRKNLLINGDFSVWQRGNIFTAPIPQQFTADRWICLGSSQSVDRQGSGGVEFGNSARMTRLDSVGAVGLYNIVELENGGDLYPFQEDKQYTLSYWVYSTSAKDAFFFMDFCDDSSGTNSVQQFNVATPVPALTWTKISYTHTMTTSIGAGSLCARIGVGVFDAEIGEDAYVGSVQFEQGIEFTPFEYVDPATQRARCQRYYEEIVRGFGAVNEDAYINWAGKNLSATASRFYGSYMVEKRTTPTATVSNPTNFQVEDAGGSAVTATGLSINTFGNKMFRATVNVAGGLVAGDANLVVMLTDSRVAFNAEL